jgi:hypothetical protein
MCITTAHAFTFKDLGEEMATPVTTDAKYVLLGGTVLTVGLLIFEDSVSDPFQDKQVRNKTLGDTSIYGDMLGQLVPNIIYAGGMAISGYYGNKKGYDRAIGMFKATAYSSAVTTVLKYAAREPRPYDKSVKNSFPSGHTTTSFAFAGYVAAEHGWAWGVPATLMATFVGYSRINDNRHYLHDVIAGATIGWVYGWGISRHANKNAVKKIEQTFVIPVVDSRTAGLSLYREF